MGELIASIRLYYSQLGDELMNLVFVAQLQNADPKDVVHGIRHAFYVALPIRHCVSDDRAQMAQSSLNMAELLAAEC